MLSRTAQSLEERTLLTAVAWDGGGDGTSWHDVLNWDTDALPGPDDDVTINLPADVTVRFDVNTASQSVKSLESFERMEFTGGALSIAEASTLHGAVVINDGTIDGSGDLTLASEVTFIGGRFTGSGMLLIAADATFDVMDGSEKALLRVTENRGIVNLKDFRLNLTVDSSTAGDRFINQPGGVFNAIGSGTIGEQNRSDVRFVNEGTFNRSGGGTTAFASSFVNTGELHLIDGTLELNVSSSSTTAVDVPAGSSLVLKNSMTYASPVALTGAGTVEFVNGTHDFTGTQFLPTGTVNFVGGNLTHITLDNAIFPAAMAPVTATLNLNVDQTLDAFVLDGGIIDGPGNLTLTGTSTIFFGTLDGTGTLLIPADATLNLPGVSGPTLARVTDNRGTVNWTGNRLNLDNRFGVNGDRFINRPEGVFNAVGTGTFSTLNGRDITFLNEGIFNRSGGGTTTFPSRFVNTGTINHVDGNLTLQQPSSSTVPLDVPLGGSLSLHDSFSYASPVALTGAGTVNFLGGNSQAISTHDFTGTQILSTGTLNFTGGNNTHIIIDNEISLAAMGPVTTTLILNVDQTLDSFVLNGGFVSGPGDLTLTGTSTIFFGTLDGDGTLLIPNGATLDLPRVAGPRLLRVTENEGTVNWTGQSLNLDNSINATGDRFINRPQGVFNAVGPGKILAFSGSNVRFLNEGVFNRSSGGTTEFFSGLTNTGIFNQVDGTTELKNSSRNSGTTNVLGGTMLFKNGVENLIDAGATFEGGRWFVSTADSSSGFAKLQFDGVAPISTLAAEVILDGVGSSFENGNGDSLLRDLQTVRSDGSLALQNEKDLVINQPLQNDGTLSLGAGSELSIGNAYTQSPDGRLTIGLGGEPFTKQFGTLISSVGVNLAGTLDLEFINGFGPANGDVFEILTYGSVNGEFDSIEGLFLDRVQVLDVVVNSTNTVVNGIVDVTDLTVASISLPLEATSGEDVTIDYTVTNLSAFPAVGDWFDSIYLSENTILDQGDLLIGRVLHTGGTVTGYSDTLTAALPAAIDGNYRVLVAVDSRGLVPDKNRRNNIVASQDVLRSSLAVLDLNGSVSGTINGEEDNFFRLDVPPGTDVSLIADFAQMGGVDVFVRFGETPAAGFHNASTSNMSLLQDELRLLGTPGSWYIQVHGRPENALRSVDYTLSANAVAFDIDSVNPSDGSNLGTVTSTILGSGFSSRSTIDLVASDGVETAATQVVLVDSNTLYASFDLTGLAEGNYDIRVGDEGRSSSLVSAFEVNGLEAGRLVIDVESTERILAGTVHDVTVRYSNAGNTDIPAPLIQLSSDIAGLVEVAANEIPAKFVTGFSNRSAVASVSPTPRLLQILASQIGLGGDRLFLGINEDGPAGILTPGGTGEVTFHFQGPPSASPPVLTFTAKVNRDEADPFDWDARKDALRPPAVSDEAWDVIFTNFKTRVGETRQSYEKALGEVATYLSRFGEATINVAELLTVLIAQANNAYPGGILAADVDASSAGVGIPLSFSRVFPQPISARHNLGPLGRGWTHQYELTFIDDSESNRFIVRSPLGDRIFEKDAEEPFELLKARGLSGDAGRLRRLGSVGVLLIDPDGTSYAFDDDGKLTSISKHNNSLQLEYTDGLLTVLKHRPSNSHGEFLDEFTLEYNELGRISRLTDHAGRVTQYEYDESGEHLLEVTDVSGTVFYTYEIEVGTAREHGLASVTNRAGLQVFYTYDEQGRLIGWERGSGAEAVTLEYGPVASVSYTDLTGATNTFSYNRVGQLAEFHDALGRIVQRRYDENQNPDFDRLPGNLSVDYSYDDRGLRQQQVGASGETAKTTIGPSFSSRLFIGFPQETISLPQNFRLKQLEDELGIRTTYTNNPFGDLVTVKYPDDSTEQFVYDSRGNVTHYTNRGGEVFSYAYNTRGQRVHSAGPSDIHHSTYDEAGNLLSISDSTGTIDFAYDSADRLVSVAYPGGRSLSYRYDEAGRRIRLSDQDGVTTNYSYDALGRLERMTDGSEQLIAAYAYDALGRLSRADRGNSTFTVYDYDAAGQLTSIVNHAPDHSVNSSFTYAYDDLGRRSEMQTVDGVWTYDYDAIGQLVRAGFASTNVDIADQDLQYVYDAAGNRIRTLLNGELTSYATNNLNQYTQVSDASYSYDADGRLTAITDADGTTEYTFDARGRLIQVEDGSDMWVYEYDALGHRSASIHNGERAEYLIDPLGLGNVVGEFDSSGNALASYSYGFGLAGRVDASGTTAFYDYDALGSTAGLSGSDGSYVNSYSYLPFGEALALSETIENSFEYIGQFGVSREENGLDYMRARYYSPTDGRFTSPDPIGIRGGINLYRYVVNSPTNLTDPSGLIAPALVIPALGAAAAEAALLTAGVAATGFALYSLYGFANTLIDEAPVHEIDQPPVVDVVDNDPTELDGDWITPLTRPVPRPWPVGPSNNQPRLPPYPGWPKPRPLLPARTGLSAFSCDLLGCNLPVDVDSSETQQVSSFDPNDIIGPAGFGDAGFITPTEFPLAYTIRFENLDKATAPAQVVTVTQQLDDDLDLSTFQFDQFGFGGETYDVTRNQNSIEARLDLREPLDVFLDVQGLLNTETGLLTWTFTSVDPATFDLPLDPLVGFLPPNQNSPEGEGFISYLVQHKQGLPTGTAFDAQASIVFDLNDAIETPAIVNTIDAAAPSSNVEPLSATTSETSFPINWGGADDSGGSGIAFFDVFVSTDGAEFVPLLEGTTETSTLFVGEDGRNYSFISIATDNVGHRETTPASADATTTVSTIDIPVTTPPTITAPIGQTPDIQPTLAWTAVEGADRYQVIGYDVARGVEVVNLMVAGANLPLAEPLLRLATYQFFVRGIRDLPDGGQEAGPFSLPEHFSIDAAARNVPAPELTGPIHQIGDPTPTITWTPVSGGHPYEMHIYDVAAGSLVFHQTSVIPTHITLGNALAAGREYTAYARVDHQDLGEWGGPLAFTVEENVVLDTEILQGRPELTGPVSAVNTSRPVITWDDFENAESYRIEIYDVDRGQRVLSADDIVATQFTSGNPLPPIPGEYEIFVRANLGQLGVSEFSQPVRTTILQHAPLPDQVQLTAPITPTIDDTPTFVWNEVPRAAAYEISIKNMNTAEEVVRVSNITDRHFIPKVPLGTGSYRVQVMGLNEHGESGPFSDPFEFEILTALDVVFTELPDEVLV